jgi:hypothetical protein
MGTAGGGGSSVRGSGGGVGVGTTTVDGEVEQAGAIAEAPVEVGNATTADTGWKMSLKFFLGKKSN